MMVKILAFSTILLCLGIGDVNADTQASKDLNGAFEAKARGVEKLLSKARSLDGQYYAGDDGAGQFNFISRYSIQFQGCHHIQQWNDNADDEDIRLQTKRLARFRLVPFEKCDVVSPWASSKAIRDASRFFGNVDYGEYLVDLNTFVAAYLEAKQEEDEYLCEAYQSTCQSKCADDDAYAGDDDGYTGCMKTCYLGYGCSGYNSNDDDNSISIYDYAECAQFDWADDDANVAYYFGPSCADQGGEIRMNLFTDDTCTTLAQCGTTGKTRGARCYTRTTGFILPGTQENLIEDPCLPCTENYVTLEESKNNSKVDYTKLNFGYPRDVCTNLYDGSGKCEKNMKNGQYNYACTYLEGIQIGVTNEGLAVAVRSSIVADFFMFTMVIASGIMYMYIRYMKGVLSKPLSS